MKKLVLGFALVIGMIGNAQNVIEVSISQIGVFAKYGNDSLHLMIAKSECGHYSRSYDPIDLKLVINKSKKKVFRFKNGSPSDTLSIKKIEFKDSIYSITVSDICNFRYAESFNKMFDCQIVLDTRKIRKNKNMPAFCYYWNCKFTINDEPMDYYAGCVTDYIIIK